MTEYRKKAKRTRETPAPAPLTPESAAALKEQVARIASALEAGQDLETIKGLVSPQPEEPLWDLHLLAALSALAHPGLPPLLAAWFGGTPDKARRKALKRAFHLLQTRGVPVPPEFWPREAPVPPPSVETAPCLAQVSPIFGTGERYVLLQGPKKILEGNFLVAFISDEAGFRECHLLHLKPQQQKELWDYYRQQGLKDWLTPPPAYAVSLLEQAYDINPAAPGASRYAGLRAKVWAHWGRPEEAPDLESLPPLSPGDQSRCLENSRQLFMNPLFHTWLPSPEEIAPWLDKLGQVQDSPLVLSEQQRQLRLEGLVEEATAALYPPDRRPLWRRRLLHMAYFFSLQGRNEEAQTAQAAAQDLAVPEPSRLTGENPFLKSLVWQALRLAWEFRQPERGSAPGSALVSPPPESLLIRR